MWVVRLLSFQMKKISKLMVVLKLHLCCDPLWTTQLLGFPLLLIC